MTKRLRRREAVVCSSHAHGLDASIKLNCAALQLRACMTLGMTLGKLLNFFQALFYLFIHILFYFPL